MPSTTDIITDSVVRTVLDKPAAQSFGEIGANSHLRPTFQADTDELALIFEASSGEPRLIPKLYLGKTLRKRHPLTNRPVFVAADPETGQPMTPVPVYETGSLMCFLHPDHPERGELEEMGIGRDIVCGDNETAPAASFRTRFDLRNHEEKRHKRSFQIREEGRSRRLAEEERAEQRRYTEAILKLAGGGAARPLHVCDVETCDRFYDSAQGLAAHKKEHK